MSPCSTIPFLSTSVSPKLNIYLFTAEVQENEINLYATIMHNKKDETIKTKPHLDCRAGRIFMDQNFTWKHGIKITKLDKPITAQNVDGTLNKKGTIRYFADLKIKIDKKTSEERFYITGLGNQKIILGFPWLKKHPQINWKTGNIIWGIVLRLQNIFSYKPVLAFGTEQMAIFNSRESKF